MGRNKRIKYIGGYDIIRPDGMLREYSLAGAKKMDYLVSVLNSLGYGVDILSPIHVKVSFGGFYPGIRMQLTKQNRLILPLSFGSKNILLKVFRALYENIWLFFYLIVHCSTNEKILVYHSYLYAWPIVLAHKIKNLEIILEIEEKYAEIWNIGTYKSFKENMMLSFVKKNTSIVVSESLSNLLGLKNTVVCYGSYNTANSLKPREKDNRVKLVFSGYVDKARGSAFLSIEAMRYLPDCYDLVLSGTINKEDEDELYSLIEDVNNILGRQACVHVGVLDDVKFSELLQKSDIALNPQKEGDYSKFLFPSKILTYMSYGLPVVSTPGESIIQSSVADLIVFSKGYSPKDIADAIKNVKACEKTVYMNRLLEMNDIVKKQIEDLFQIK